MEPIKKVLANCTQSFTESEKATARENIGAQQTLVQGSNIEIVGNTISAVVPSPEPIPSVNNGELDIRVNGVSQGTFTANQPGDTAVDISVPTGTADLLNDAGFITESALPTVNNGTLTIKKNGTTVQTFTANSSTDKTADISVPQKTSDLQNDSGFITSADLPTVGNGQITIQKNGSTVDSFKVNQSSAKTINITVPQKTSDLQNDSGFITSSDLPAVNDGVLTIQKNGVDVQTFSANEAQNKAVNIIVPDITAGTYISVAPGLNNDIVVTNAMHPCAIGRALYYATLDTSQTDTLNFGPWRVQVHLDALSSWGSGGIYFAITYPTASSANVSGGCYRMSDYHPYDGNAISESNVCYSFSGTDPYKDAGYTYGLPLPIVTPNKALPELQQGRRWRVDTGKPNGDWIDISAELRFIGGPAAPSNNSIAVVLKGMYAYHY